MSKGDPAAELDAILHHHRQHVSENFPAPGICVSRCADSQPRWPCGAYRAAAAAKAALKLADDWDAKAREIATQITWQDTGGAVAGFKMIGVTRYQEGAKSLREAIRAELLREAGDGR